jgi:hypothetical protein
MQTKKVCVSAYGLFCVYCLTVVFLYEISQVNLHTIYSKFKHDQFDQKRVITRNAFVNSDLDKNQPNTGKQQ